MIIIGIIILLVGGIVSVSWGLLDDPDDNSSSYNFDSSSNSQDEQEEYNDNCRTIRTIENILMFVGVIFLSTGLVIGAIKDNSLYPNTHLGMLIAISLIVGFKIASFLNYYVGF